jgi:hypothetical protein
LEEVETTNCESDKYNYRIAAQQCSISIRKYNANKELELVRKNNLGSFYNFVRNKPSTRATINEIIKPDSTLVVSEHDIAETLNNFFEVFLPLMMAPLLKWIIVLIRHQLRLTQLLLLQ